MLIRYLLSALVATCLLSSHLPAASLVRALLFTDGSVDPPGDRIDVEVVFGADEQQVRLDVYAVVIPLEGERTVSRVMARGERNRGSDGRFKTTAVVKRTADRAVGRGAVVIPYADLALARGVHRLAYEVHGYSGEQLQFIKPTRLTDVEVTDGTRRELTRVITIDRPETVVQPTTVYRLDGEQQEVREVALKRTRYGSAEESTTHKVAIEGEFKRSEIGDVAKAPDQVRAEPSVLLKELRPKHERTVYFATNRRRTADGKFTAELADELQCGSCIVNVPVDSHKRGSLELPPTTRDWWKKIDPSKFFYIYDTRTITREQLLADLSADDVLLYVHGFNNTFGRAILTTAQLKLDLGFPGKATSFTWPANTGSGLGMLGGYRTAERHVAQSAESLAQMLEILLANREKSSTPADIHIIAHSLGNRLLLDAVHRLVSQDRIDSGTKVFSNVVLAAADVDWSTFAAQAPSLVSCSKRITYYYSTADFPLKLSKQLHEDRPPIGLCPLLHPQVDTINANNVNGFSIGFGHGYFSSSNPVLVDLNLILVSGFMPERRQPPLGNRQQIAGYDHWEFLPVSH